MNYSRVITMCFAMVLVLATGALAASVNITVANDPTRDCIGCDLTIMSQDNSGNVTLSVSAPSSTQSLTLLALEPDHLNNAQFGQATTQTVMMSASGGTPPYTYSCTIIPGTGYNKSSLSSGTVNDTCLITGTPVASTGASVAHVAIKFIATDSTAGTPGVAVGYMTMMMSTAPPTYTISSSAGANGSISCSPGNPVSQGSNVTCNITASSGYQISTVTVDGSSVGAVSSRQFTNINADHTISATFSQVPTYTITSSAGSGGGISCSPANPVTQGSNVTCNITPNGGYQIATVTVDGATVSATSPYVFNGVSANHSISATFSVSTSPTYTISASAGSGGGISCSPANPVTQGSNVTCNITASLGYQLSSVTVDNAAVSTTSSYVFYGVSSNHSISATFSQTSTPPPSGGTLITKSTVNYSVGVGGSNHHYIDFDTAITKSVTVKITTRDWGTDQDMLVSDIDYPACGSNNGNILNRTPNPAPWYSISTSNNESLYLTKLFAAGTRLYVTICNKSTVSGQYGIYWSGY